MSVSLGYNEAITIDQVVASAQADLGLIDNDFYNVLLEKWIYEGVRHLSTNQLFVKKPVTLTVNDNKATLPADFRRLLALRYNSDVEIENADGSTSTEKRCFPLVYVDTAFAAECGCENIVNGYGWRNYLASFEIIGNQIIFHQNIVDGSEVNLSYLGFAVDDNCLLLIKSDFERALSAYCRMRFLQAYPEVKGKMTPILLQESKNEWQNQKAWCKGIAVTQEFINNRYQIVALARAWFVRQSYEAEAQF